MTIIQLPFKDCTVLEEFYGGSKRRFMRVRCGGERYVVMRGSTDEVERYVSVARELYRKHVPVPRIYRQKDGFVLMEDLGDLSLYRFVKLYGENLDIYEKVIKELVNLQQRSIEGLERFGYDKLHGEYLHFKEYYAPYAGLDTFLWDKKIEYIVEKCLETHFVPMHRDFQSTNIYIKEGKVYFVDFQDMHTGPVYFDLAALLFDPYVMLQNRTIEELLDYYKNISGFDFDNEVFLACGILRIMQALGAFVRLSKEGKEFFKRFIKGGICRLKGLLRDMKLDNLADSL